MLIWRWPGYVIDFIPSPPADENISGWPYPYLLSTLPRTTLRCFEMVEAAQSLDFSRPIDGSAQGMRRQRRGTCSTKHLFLASLHLTPQVEVRVEVSVLPAKRKLVRAREKRALRTPLGAGQPELRKLCFTPR